MAYEARRDYDDEELDKAQKKAESDAANQKATKAGLKAVSKTGGWWGAAAKGIDKADDITGGKITELAGKGLTHANKVAPLGKAAQGLTNKVANSKAADSAYKAYNAKNKKGADTEDLDKLKEAKEKKEELDKLKEVKETKKGEPKSSPSSSEEKAKKEENKPEVEKEVPQEEPKDDDEVDTEQKKGSGVFKGLLTAPIFISLIPILMPIFIVVVILISMFGVVNEFTDAFGVSEVAGLETGGLSNISSDPTQNAFYQRVNEVKMDFQSSGKDFDPVVIAAVYHSLSTYKNTVYYDDMTTDNITEIANAMFKDDVYDEENFKIKLKEEVIPKYLNISETSIDSMINDIFEYIKNYNELVGKNKENYSDCVSGDSCTYELNGFQLNKTKSSSRSIKAKDIYVRLMQCGGDYGGTAGKPLEGEELVPFEKYVLGAAYAEMGDISATKNAENKIKTQLVVARSFTLARHADVGGWRSLKEENGKWILQIGNCTRDQLYCDPDKGCSKSKSSKFHLYSGKGKYAGTWKSALGENHPYRKYAQEVQGEVLVNNKGYVIQASFQTLENKRYTELANQGFDYKQILMTVYNSGRTNFGAAKIYKADCGGSCPSEGGEASTWKQFDKRWASVKVGTSGKTIKDIGCTATSIAIQIARSGTSTKVSGEFNPGTFVKYLNDHNGFNVGDFIWTSATLAAPNFKYQNVVDVSGLSKKDKYNKMKDIVNQKDVYAIVEVMGNTGQHWVAIEKAEDNDFRVMDPGFSDTTLLWKKYDWFNTSRIVYYKVNR